MTSAISTGPFLCPLFPVRFTHLGECKGECKMVRLAIQLSSSVWPSLTLETLTEIFVRRSLIFSPMPAVSTERMTLKDRHNYNMVPHFCYMPQTTFLLL